MLSTTALVHEAYPRLAGVGDSDLERQTLAARIGRRAALDRQRCHPARGPHSVLELDRGSQSR